MWEKTRILVWRRRWESWGKGGIAGGRGRRSWVWFPLFLLQVHLQVRLNSSIFLCFALFHSLALCMIWFTTLWLMLVSEANEDDLSNLHRIGQLVTDLIMWKDASKSSFWFGFGSVCFLSSCFTRGISFRYPPHCSSISVSQFSSIFLRSKESKNWGFHVFSIFSAISQLGLLFLGLSFFSNSLYQR